MISACGAASTLLAFNAANAAAGRTGGYFDLDRLAAVDPDVAGDQLGGREFVFDVQGHFVGQNGLGPRSGRARPQRLFPPLCSAVCAAARLGGNI